MSKITIVNNTKELVGIAVFRKPVLQRNLGAIAWRVVEPPLGGQTVVPIPDDYAVFASYLSDPFERQDPNAGTRTNTIAFGATTARFLVESAPSRDPRVSAAVMTQAFVGLMANEVRIENQFGSGLWAHITKDGNDALAPQVIWPGSVLIEDLRASFQVAVVSQFVHQGDRLVDEEIALTEVEVSDGATFTVTGSRWRGYRIDCRPGPARDTSGTTPTGSAST